MRHKKIILVLIGVLIVLIFLKVYGPNWYPMSMNFDYGKEAKLERLSTRFLKDRETPSTNAIRWDSFSIGDTQEQVKTSAKNTTESTVVLAGNTFPCKTNFFYDSDGKLTEVHFSFPQKSVSARTMTSTIVGIYGEHYLRINHYNKLMHENDDERYYWIDGGNLVFYEHYLNEVYFCVADISFLTDEQLKRYLRFGSISQYDPYQAHILGFYEREKRGRRNSSSSRSRTYKYGDSDTYQGSSQQKADLKAIDNYFGF